MSGRRTITESEIDRIEEMYVKGAKMKDIVAETGYSSPTIATYLRKRGVYDPKSRVGRRGLDDAVVDRMVEMYGGGSTQREIADELGVSTVTVSKYLRERGVATRRRNGKLDTGTVDRIVSAYVSGESAREIAEREGITATTARKYLAVSGARPHGRPNMAEMRHGVDVQRLIDEYESGRSIRSLAKETDISELTMGRLLRRNGAKMRGRRRVTDEDARRIVECYTSGNKTLAEVAKECNTSVVTASKYLFAAGVDTSRRRADDGREAEK